MIDSAQSIEDLDQRQSARHVLDLFQRLMIHHARQPDRAQLGC